MTIGLGAQPTRSPSAETDPTPEAVADAVWREAEGRAAQAAAHEHSADAEWRAADRARTARREPKGFDAAALQRVLVDGPYERCLVALLSAAGWGGDPRHLIDAAPHLEAIGSLGEFRVTLTRLGYRAEVAPHAGAEAVRAALPALIVDEGRPLVALSLDAEGAVLAFDGVDGVERRFDLRRPVVLCRIAPALSAEDEHAAENDPSWIRRALARLAPEAAFAAGLTLGANVLALATPLFTMAVYNAVIPSEGVDTLVFAAMIVIGALLLEGRLRAMRADLFADAAARVGWAMLTASFARIVHLPMAMLEAATVSSQTNRLRQFESMLAGVSGTVAGALFDLPFVLVFLFAIWMIGGPLVWVPIVSVVLLLCLTIVLAPATAQAGRRAAASRERADTLLRETLAGVETVQSLGAEAIWRRRVAEAMRRAVSARLASNLLEQLRQGAAQFSTSVASIATLWCGALLVMEGLTTVGALIAVTMLSARVVTPLQTLFLAVGQVHSALGAARQVDGLMRLKTERAVDTAPTVFRRFEGRLRLREVSFRYPGADEFALRGLTAEIAPGETIGLVGGGGAGKSSLLKLLVGFYRPTGGQVFLDGLNLGQVETAELRAAIAYTPSQTEFFYGTIIQNMRLARGSASEAEIAAVLEELGIELDPNLFPDGLSTRLGAQDFRRLPEPLRQKLALARTLVKGSPVMLLDEPSMLLDAAGQAVVRDALARRRGRAATVLSTRDPALLDLCDRVMVLSGGQIAAFAPRDEVLERFASAR